MKILSIIFFALLAKAFCDDEFPLEKDVIILTNGTFDKAVEKYEYLLVLFYSPWCGRCKKFHPEYEKAATVLRKENLYLSKVDVSKEIKLAGKYNVQGLPAVKLFIKGQPIEYTGGRKDWEVINWIRKKTQPATKDLKTSDEVEQFKKENEVVLVYFGSNKTDIEEFTKVAIKNEEFPFAIVQSEEVIKQFTKPRTVVLFKNFDEKKRELTEVKERSIDNFIYRYSEPKVMKFDGKTSQIIFRGAFPAIILFAKEKCEKWEEYEKLMRSISDKVNGKLKVVLTDIKGDTASKLAEYMGIKENDLPSIRIVDTRIRRPKKYFLEGEINEQNILRFVEDWDNRKIRPYLKTSEEPKDNNGDVLIVVGKTFERDVIKNDKDIMVFFYAPWCERCKALHPIYEEVAKKLKEKNPKLIMAKIDATENEVESINISIFPTVKFYPGNKKDKAPLEYIGARSAYGIIKYLKANAATPIIYEENKENEEEKKKDDKIKTEEL